MRSLLSTGLILLGLTLTAAQAPAQIRAGEFGFQVTGQLGTAGEFCWGFDCTPRPGAAVRGETLGLTTRAPFLAPYAIGISFGAGSCRDLPGVTNQLVLDFPLLVLTGGLVSQPSSIKACYGGVEHDALRVPAFLPPGFQFGLQAATVLPTGQGLGPALSAAVLVTVQ